MNNKGLGLTWLLMTVLMVGMSLSPMAGTAYESVDSAMSEDDDTTDMNEIQNTDSEGIVPEFVDRMTEESKTEESKEELKEELKQHL